MTSNVAGAEIKGLEAEIVWLLGDSGTLNLAVDISMLNTLITLLMVQALVLIFLQSLTKMVSQPDFIV